MSLRFSIIVPTLNVGPLLADCLESLASQTFDDFEVIVVDGGSTDSTLQTAGEFFGRLPSLTIVSRDRDRGVYDAMNLGIDIAKGSYVYFMGGSDSLYSDNVLEDVSAELVEDTVLYGNVLVNGSVSWAEAGTLYDGYFDTEKLLTKNICHQAIFYPRSCLESRRYDVDHSVVADWEMNIRLWSERPFTYTDRVIANFRGGGISAARIAAGDFPLAHRQSLLGPVR